VLVFIGVYDLTWFPKPDGYDFLDLNTCKVKKTLQENHLIDD
jgi:hypothetical protein